MSRHQALAFESLSQADEAVIVIQMKLKPRFIGKFVTFAC